MNDEPKDKDMMAWTRFTRAADDLINILSGPHSLHSLIMNDIDHRAHDVRIALDKSRYFWRFDLKKERPKAIVLDAPKKQD